MAGTTHQERGLPAHHGGGTLPLAECFLPMKKKVTCAAFSASVILV
jgi:hypothetical protein